MAKVNYSTPNTGSWASVADDIFLAQFRGRPCIICGKTHSIIKGVKTRSCGHHIAKKELCRALRYTKRNIAILCPEHHTRFTGNISPHSENSVECGLWYEWLFYNRPDQWEWVKEHYLDDKTGCVPYKEAYVRLGGQITEVKFKKDEKPLNHAKTVRDIEARNK